MQKEFAFVTVPFPHPCVLHRSFLLHNWEGGNHQNNWYFPRRNGSFLQMEAFDSKLQTNLRKKIEKEKREKEENRKEINRRVNL